jgi:transposase
MANKRISMKKIREVYRLFFESNLSQRQISLALSISRPCISDYLNGFYNSGINYSDIKNMNDEELWELVKTNKPKVNERYKILVDQFEYFQKELTKTGVTLELLWQEYKSQNTYAYSYSQFCYHFKNWQKNNNIYMHQEYKAGDKMFVDFAGKKLHIKDPGTKELIPVEVFVAILGCSQLTYVEAVESQKLTDWINVNQNALLFFGGVPNAIIPDCLKSGVKKTSKYEPEINPQYADFAQHYNTVILPARPGKPKDKPLVENAVKIVYMRIYAHLRNKEFYSIDDLNSAIKELLEKHNNKDFKKIKMSRRGLFDQLEKKELKSLPLEKYEYKEFQQAKVDFNYHVKLKEDNHYYSVPWRLRQIKAVVKLYYTANNVEIYHNNIRIVSYKRDKTNNRYTTLTEHMPAHHKYYAEWNPERIKSWAEKIGEDVRIVVENIMKNSSHPEQGFRSCVGVINLGKTHGETRLIKACKRAIDLNYYSYRFIKNILVKKLENIQPELEFYSIPYHQNIRGKEFYN